MSLNTVQTALLRAEVNSSIKRQTWFALIAPASKTFAQPLSQRYVAR